MALMSSLSGIVVYIAIALCPMMDSKWLNVQPVIAGTTIPVKKVISLIQNGYAPLAFPRKTREAAQHRAKTKF
jgi:hypothetical protein